MPLNLLSLETARGRAGVAWSAHIATGGSHMPSAKLLLAAAALAAATTQAHAATFFSDAADFAAATTGLTTGNFDGIAPPGQSTTAFSFTVQGVTFKNNVFSGVIDAASDFAIYGNRSFYSGFGSPISTISFAGTTAFGLEFGSSNISRGRRISFTLSDGSLFSTTVPAVIGTTAFFGFTSATPITGITVNTEGTSGFFTFDVVSFSVGDAWSAAGVIPEPATWALMIAGFGLVGETLRRRRLAAA